MLVLLRTTKMVQWVWKLEGCLSTKSRDKNRQAGMLIGNQTGPHIESWAMTRIMGFWEKFFWTKACLDQNYGLEPNFCHTQAPSWILSKAKNLASSSLQDGATKWL